MAELAFCPFTTANRPWNRIEDYQAVWNHALPLIEAEALEALAGERGGVLGAAESRRNLTTRGVRLTGLIGRRFAIGEVDCEGVDHCPPCHIWSR
jgi:MOSC domain-containing protein YiiM